MIELMSLKKIMTRMSVFFVIIITFFFFLIKYQAFIFDDCLDLLLQKVVSFDDAAIFIASQIIAEFIY